MISIKLLVYIGTVSALFATIAGVYFAGVSAGKDSATFEHSFMINEAHKEYQLRLELQAENYKRETENNLTSFETEIKARVNDAKALALAESVASNVAIEIKERIKYVESDCVSVGNDAYSLYKQTRDIISDPRITDSDITEDTSEVQSESISTMLQRPKTSQFKF